jgi:hypothetical protein
VLLFLNRFFKLTRVKIKALFTRTFLPILRCRLTIFTHILSQSYLFPTPPTLCSLVVLFSWTVGHLPPPATTRRSVPHSTTSRADGVGSRRSFAPSPPPPARVGPPLRPGASTSGLCHYHREAPARPWPQLSSFSATQLVRFAVDGPPSVINGEEPPPPSLPHCPTSFVCPVCCCGPSLYG